MSQRLGTGFIKLCAMLLFWPTIAGFCLCLSGSGRIRFVGIGTSLATGVWWLLLAMDAAISMGAPTVRHPIRYLVPNGYVGIITIKHGENAPPLKILNGTYICRIPAIGVLATSSPIEDGWAKDEYFYYSDNDSLQALPETGWGARGMIWAGSIGHSSTADGTVSKKFTQTFFVGTEKQYNQHVASPVSRP